MQVVGVVHACMSYKTYEHFLCCYMYGLKRTYTLFHMFFLDRAFMSMLVSYLL